MNKDLLPLSMIVLLIFSAKYIYSSDYKKPTKYTTRSSQSLYIKYPVSPIFDRLIFMSEYFKTRLPENQSCFNTSIEDYFKNLEKNHSSLSLSSQNISQIPFSPKIHNESKFSFASKIPLFPELEKNHFDTWNKLLSLNDQ